MSKFIKEHGYDERKINDFHYHNGRQCTNSEMTKFYRQHREYLNLEKMLVLSLTGGATTYDPSSNMKALFSKEDDKDNMYALASLHHFHDERDSEEGFLRQIKFFKEIGYDGLKMLEGKVEYKHIFPEKLDGKLYNSLFKYAEETGFPILMHAGDVPNSEEMRLAFNNVHAEMLNVLEKYPNLKITFAHMLFLSDNIEKLTEIFEKYPNVSVDLALGGFMRDISDNVENWRTFFIKYSDRILFATDNWNMFFEGDDDFEVSCRYTPVRDWLERKEEFTTRLFGPKAVFKPSLLPENVLDDIYRKNFVRILGEKPAKVNYPLALKYAKWMLAEYENGNFNTSLRAKEMPSWYTEKEKENLFRGTELSIENLKEMIDCYSKIGE